MLTNWLQLFHDQTAAVALACTLGYALAKSGSALLNDLDHKDSTITSSFGPLSLWAHKGVVQIHYFVADLTKQGGDRKPPGAHRGVTHYWPAPLVTGLLVAGLCYWNRWALFGVLVVLYTAAIRGITVPDYMPKPTHSVRRRWSMRTTHNVLDLKYGFLIVLTVVCLLGSWLISTWFLVIGAAIIVLAIPMYLLKRAHKHTARTYTIHLTYWTKLAVPVGKIMTILVAADLALIVTHYPWIVRHGYWLGAVVCLGMYLHILGDAPTEMGIPGRNLYQFWRLPKWLAFKAGGVFEILALQAPMAGLGVILIPGVLPRAWDMLIQGYIMWTLGLVTATAIVTETITRYSRQQRKKAWR